MHDLDEEFWQACDRLDNGGEHGALAMLSELSANSPLRDAPLTSSNAVTLSEPSADAITKAVQAAVLTPALKPLPGTSKLSVVNQLRNGGVSTVSATTPAKDDSAPPRSASSQRSGLNSSASAPHLSTSLPRAYGEKHATAPSGAGVPSTSHFVSAVRPTKGTGGYSRSVSRATATW